MNNLGNQYKRLENNVGYTFVSKRLLKLALTHSSYENENGNISESNERLEFLGDAVVSLASADLLYNEFSDLDEGMLTKIRSSLVCTESLSKYASKIALDEYLLLGKGERKNLDNPIHVSRLLENTFEALVGAIYLDGGFDEAYKFLKRMMSEDIENFNFHEINEKLFHDYKSLLQKKLQQHGMDLPQYIVVSQEGPIHDTTFEIEVKINNKTYAVGIGKNKKSAEQDAAEKALAVLENEEK